MPESLHVGDLEIDTVRCSVRLAARDVRLGKKEWKLLELLVTHANHVLTHRQLLLEIWGETYGDESKYLLHALVRRLRKKIADSPPRYIVAVADIGYRFVTSAPQPSASSLE